MSFPVPKPYLYCEDASVIGTEFYIMEHIKVIEQHTLLLHILCTKMTLDVTGFKIIGHVLIIHEAIDISSIQKHKRITEFKRKIAYYTSFCLGCLELTTINASEGRGLRQGGPR